MKKENQKYGLLTAVSMIVGIVVGSGIFFKADEVLNYTGGNVTLGVLAFCIGALSIIFGCLTVAELAIISSKSGGFIGYYEEFTSHKIAGGVGWHQLFVSFPTLMAVVSYVAGNYITLFLGIDNSPETCILISIILIFVFLGSNVLSAKFGSLFQNATTIIKLVPFIVLTIGGFLLAGNVPKLPEGLELVKLKDVGFSWVAALVPVAFTYDGWIVATSIANEIKNPKKNIPRALTIGPIIVLIAYVMYFIGINNMLGPQYIMTVGNASINYAGKMVFGSFGDRIILGFVIVSVLGVVNGIAIGILRMPYILQTKNMLPGHYSQELSFKSSVIPALTVIFWSIMHYIFLKSKVLGSGSDVSSIAIVIGYIFYCFLYIKVIQMRLKGKLKSNLKGLVFPVLAIIGSLIIIIGGAVSDPLYAIAFSTFNFLVFAGGYFYSRKSASQTVS